MQVEPATLLQRFGDFDVVLSDMAPKTSGDKATDQFRSEALTQRALSYAKVVLRPGGHFAAKVFQGPGFTELLTEVRRSFSQAKSFHPPSTRAGSKEQYVVGRGLLPGARLT